MTDAQLTTSTIRNDAFALQMEGVTKRFPGVTANRDISIKVRKGAFHAIIGENGAGKSTLLNILYGRFQPDEGRLVIGGEEVTHLLSSPQDAIARGIGLVSQHYSLIPALTVFENIALGSEPASFGGVLRWSKAENRVRLLMEQLGLKNLELKQTAERLTVAAGQKVEILKALYRGTKILLLDEPTATLAPQEVESLFEILTTLIDNDSTIVFVTHKLREVLKYSDEVSVLRAGKLSGHFKTSETDEIQLLHAMIGSRPPQSKTPRAQVADDLGDASSPILTTRSFQPDNDSTSMTGSNDALFAAVNISVKNSRGSLAVEGASFKLGVGEIVGIAGVDGSGQRELAEAIAGLRPIVTGDFKLTNSGVADSISRLSVRERQRSGIAYIPEDRHRSAMILDFSLAENFLLGNEDRREWGGGFTLNPKLELSRANDAIRDYDVRAGDRDASALAKVLSGGNQQKLVIARALANDPKLLIACQPTRGLDIEATKFVYRTLLDAKERGLGILLFSLDLDEILKLSDRILVMFNGKIAGELPRLEATPELIGALMTGGNAEVQGGVS